MTACTAKNNHALLQAEPSRLGSLFYCCEINLAGKALPAAMHDVSLLNSKTARLGLNVCCLASLVTTSKYNSSVTAP